ncbi:MAG: DnaJ C-terminal domain-containing protein [Polyangiales bacterium]
MLSDPRRRRSTTSSGKSGSAKGSTPTWRAESALRARQASAAAASGSTRSAAGRRWFRRGRDSPPGPRPHGAPTRSRREAELPLEFLTPFEARARNPSARPGHASEGRIPAGIRDGEKLRLRGQQRRSTGAPPADLVLTIRVRSHPDVWYEEDGLHLRLPVRPLEAYDGAKVGVSTPQGNVTVRIPPGSRSGQTLRLRGKGASRRGSEPGDLFVHLELQVPTQGDAELRKALEVLDNVLPDVRAGVPKLDGA